MPKPIRWGIGILLVLIVLGTLLPRRPDATPPDPGYAQPLLAARAKKDSLFRADSASPLLPPVRLHFRGLTYYPIDPRFRLKATFWTQADSLAFGDSLALPVGTLTLSFEGRTYTLRTFREVGTPADRLFVPFGDRTNGSETYGGGRYVVAQLPPDTREVVIDFNTAYHPYCAYNPRYVCPVVPPENKLPFSVEAGERGYAEPL